MISNLKLTDGDLLFVNVEGDNVSNDYLNKIRDRLDTWCKRKGLTNVEIMVSGGNIKYSITKMTVNDVFEEDVLKG